MWAGRFAWRRNLARTTIQIILLKRGIFQQRTQSPPSGIHGYLTTAQAGDWTFPRTGSIIGDTGRVQMY